jgi:hypothetical protein
MRIECSLDAVQCSQRSNLRREALQLCAEVFQDGPRHVIHGCKCGARHPQETELQCGTETPLFRERLSLVSSQKRLDR